MGLLLKQLFGLVKLLNSETGTYQIAAGFAAGFVLGMTPVFSLQTVLVFVLLLVFRIQIGAAFISAFFFTFIAFLLDPVFHVVGEKVLALQSLQGLYTTMFNMPIVPLTRFYNTIVMGSAVVTVLLSPFVFLLAVSLVHKYRHSVYERFKQSKFFKALQATTIYKWYYKYDQLYG